MSNLLSNFNKICTRHFMVPSADCMTCAMLSVTASTYASQFGTSDLPNFACPEPSPFLPAGPAIPNPYFLSYQQMKPLSPLPIRAPSIRFITQTQRPKFENLAPEDDFYPERFALSPDEQMPMLAGISYSDKFAPDEKDLALSEVKEEVPKPKKRRGRPRKYEVEHRKELKHAKEGIVVDGSETLVPEQEQRQESSPLKVGDTDSNTSDCNVVEVPEGRKRNTKLKYARDSAELETKTKEQRSVKRLRKEKTKGEQIGMAQRMRGKSTRKTQSTRPVRATRSRVNYSE